MAISKQDVHMTLNNWSRIVQRSLELHTHDLTCYELCYNLFVYYTKKVLIIICNAMNLCSVTVLILF